MNDRRYQRFIPREELRAYAAWTPGRFGEAPAAPPAETEQDRQARQALELQAQRAAAHEEGLREGLQALEALKQAHEAELAARMMPLLDAFRAQLARLEQGLAAEVAALASEIARQVLRQELATRPELIEAVARDALAALLASARQLRIRLHPEDQQWLQERGGPELAAREAQLLADPAQVRGGCVVESDIAGVDASLPARWQRVHEALGLDSAWRAEARGGA